MNQCGKSSHCSLKLKFYEWKRQQLSACLWYLWLLISEKTNFVVWLFFSTTTKKREKKIFLINWNPNNIIARAKTVEGNSNFQSCYFFNYERNHFQCLSCPLAFTNLTVPLIFISLLHPGAPFLCALLPFYTHKTAVSFWKNKKINEPENSIFYLMYIDADDSQLSQPVEWKLIIKLKSKTGKIDKVGIPT